MPPSILERIEALEQKVDYIVTTLVTRADAWEQNEVVSSYGGGQPASPGPNRKISDDIADIVALLNLLRTEFVRFRDEMPW